MAIQVKVSDVTVSDGLLDMLMSNLSAPAKGELTVVDVSLAFDAGDPSDAKWIAMESQANAALEQAQSDHADAVEIDDKAMIAACDQRIRQLTIAKDALYDNAFGYYVRTNGKATVLKGSLLDRVSNAVNEMNKRIAATGDSVTVRKVDVQAHTLKVVRSATAKRTRVLRPTLASIADQTFKHIDALTATDTE